jgi:SNF2 family DNA or RNA helicase
MPVGEPPRGGSGSATITRGSTSYEIVIRFRQQSGEESRASRAIPIASFKEWVRSCSVTDSLRLELADRVEFPIGPQPVRGARRPSLGDLLLPHVASRDIPEALYRFQADGVAWLSRNPRAILADDMGLGKTVQVLVALDQIIAEELGSQALVVTPKTLLPNWLRESAKWTPGLVVRSAQELGAGSLRGGAHVVLCTYEELKRLPRLRQRPWRVLVADEAHRLRTGESEEAECFREVQSECCWLLTGTPIEHSATDLAMLLSYLDPVRFSAKKLLSTPEAVRPTARPYLLRRRKSDVLNELPAVHRRDIAVQLTAKQSQRYFDTLFGRDGERRNQLQKLAACRSICDLDPDDETSGKLDWLEDFIASKLPHDEKVVVFSAYLPILRAAMRRFRSVLPGACMYIAGDTPPEERQDLVSEFQQEGGPRVLLVSMGVGAEGITLTRANHVVFASSESGSTVRFTSIACTCAVRLRNVYAN